VERLEMGYELADVVEEYSILRSCITGMAAEEHAPAMRSNELPRLHRAIDLAIALSVQRYEQAAAEQRNSLGAELNRERARADETLADAQRRAAELEAVIESIPDAVYIGDETGMKRSTSGRSISSASTLAITSTRPFRGSFPSSRSATRRRASRCRRRSRSSPRRSPARPPSREVIVRNKKSGEDMVLRSAAAPICLGDKLVGAVAINTDITERIRQERGLREALELSERLGGVLAHDLRNPLGVITTSASLLQREALEMRHARIVGRISRSAERIERMIHDLLDYTRAQKGGGLPANPRPIDLADTCRLVAEESELLFPGSKVVVDVEGNGRGEWDPDRIYQAISNLVVNAVRHGAPNLPVKIDLGGSDRDVTVSVHNNGPAIPLEAVGTIFEPFQRGPSAGTSRSGGLGLGLYIVRQIALAHGGTVEMTSDDSVGTTFYLRLPRKR
jgi:signal transduction histidine kinase